jgi:hypothetical protein
MVSKLQGSRNDILTSTFKFEIKQGVNITLCNFNRIFKIKYEKNRITEGFFLQVPA